MAIAPISNGTQTGGLAKGEKLIVTPFKGTAEVSQTAQILLMILNVDLAPLRWQKLLLETVVAIQQQGTAIQYKGPCQSTITIALHTKDNNDNLLEIIEVSF
ncbi:MAG: hypothetical protein A4S09_10720 [Proteobacteria bacterium SG_bin7]|nr:MAG: hypothetical protein A4S09_10720 [Proteobacteria bacterium SG_bin7]